MSNKMNQKAPLYFCLFLFVIILSTTAVFALGDFDVTYAAKVDSININESSFYSVTIFNNENSIDRFQIYTISTYWDLTPSIINVNQTSKEVFDLEINPLDSKMGGPFLVPITIKSLNSGKTKLINLYVYVKSANPVVLQYVPNVAMEATIKPQLDPREKRFPLEIYVRNRNPLNYPELKVIISSAFFNKEYTTTLGPLEEKTNQVLFELDALQAPGTYTIDIQLQRDNQTINEVRKDIQVISYSDIAFEQTKTSTFLSSEEIIYVKNNGNNDAEKVIKIPKNFFEKIFTTTSAKYTNLNEHGVDYISWNLQLKPQQDQELIIRTNYTILLILFIIIVVLIILYYIFRSPVLLYKRGKILSTSHEGTSEIKIKLHVRNRSGRPIKNIKIMDKYPKMTEVEDETSLGTIKPTKLLSSDKSHGVLMWTLESLDPYEERLFTYKLQSKLKIIGNINLPSAKVKFLSKTGIERSVFSNNVKLYHKSEQPVGEFVDVDQLVKKE